MKTLLYGKRTGFSGQVRNKVENGSIGQLLNLALKASVIIICNKTCGVVLWVGNETVYFDCMTEVTFNRVEELLLKPYSRYHGGKLSVGDTEDENMYCTPVQTILTGYAERLKASK